MPGMSFTTETGGAVLEGEFGEVTLHRHQVRLSIPGAGPVVTYLGSVRDPVLSYVGAKFDFDAALDDVAARVEEIVQAEGRFRAVSRSGVFVCR
jgi:hypothetical protein